MKELAKEYKQSLKLLNKGINRVQAEKCRLLSAPETDYVELIEANHRLRLLASMQQDLREVTKEVEHYYDKGWWRSERHTLNSRHSVRRYIYTGYLYEEGYDE